MLTIHRHLPAGSLRAAALALALPAAACSGSGQAAAPQPSPSPSGATLTTAVRAARGTEQAAFAALHAQALVAQFARPGRGPLVPASATAPPTCDPLGGGTATATASDIAQQYYYTTFVDYQPGDTACARSPLAVGLIAYPNPATAPKPLVAQGYLAGWAPADDPFYAPGVAFEFDTFALTVTNAADGQAQLAIAYTGSDGYLASGLFPQRPPAGAFPNTFPVVLPKTITGFGADDAFSTSVALAEQAQQTSLTSIVQPSGLLIGTYAYLPAGYPPAQAQPTHTTLLGQAALTAAAVPGSSGTGVAFSGGAVPGYAFSSVAPLALAGFPPAAGSSFGFQPGLGITVAAGAANFPAGQQRTSMDFTYAGFASGGEERFVDAANQVAVDIVASSGGYALTITDLISGKPMTSPAVVPVDLFGNAAPYTFVFDGTGGIVRAYTVLE